MPLNVLFAAGFFDNPWAVAVLLIAGALVNWLTKRRAEKEARRLEGEEPPAAPGQPASKLDFEEALRRLMGEEPPTQAPAPPPLPDAARGGPPPFTGGQEQSSYRTTGPTVPTLRPPPVPLPPDGIPAAVAGERLEQVARRFEELEESVRHSAIVVEPRRRHRSRAAGRTASRWRDPRSARQAFVAAMIFAPPKSLEP